MILLRSFLFYPLLALAATGLILLSLGAQPWADQTPAAQAGVIAKTGARAFGPAALSRIDTGDAHVKFSPRNGAGAVSGLHLAVKTGAPARPPATERGARLLLSADAAAALAGQKLRAEIDVRPMPFATAPALALSVQGQDGPVIWLEAATGTEPKTLIFDLPAQAAPTAIGLYVINPLGNNASAVDIGEIRLVIAN
jgi:hypothetical protein